MNWGSYNMDLSVVRGANGGAQNDENADTVTGEISSLGTELAASATGLLKDVRFTAFVNRKAFRYAKYWVAARDALPGSALANYFKEHWWEDYVRRVPRRPPCFDKWWAHNGQYIRQRINQKRTNNIGQLRKVFKGMFCEC